MFRLIHADTLPVYLERGAIHAPNHMPQDGLHHRTIHSIPVQTKRSVATVPCGSGGTIHDYVAFYFGYLSPMLFQLKTGWVAGYSEGQEPLIYLVATCQAIAASGARFVFSDGHGIARYTKWYEDLADLPRVDWEMVYQRYWTDDPSGDNDRQRRKQAEFLVHRSCDWSLIEEIAVLNDAMATRVKVALGQFPSRQHPPVAIRSGWYY